jgi:hypothetical protein
MLLYCSYIPHSILAPACNRVLTGNYSCWLSDLAGTSSFAGSTAFQDNRTFLSGIEWYGAAGNKTLTGVNFVA